MYDLQIFTVLNNYQNYVTSYQIKPIQTVFIQISLNP